MGSRVSQKLCWPVSGQGQDPASQGSVWPVLWDQSFLAFGVCLLVGEAGLEACAGFLVGGVSACYWWEKLGVGTVVGWAVSRDKSKSRGRCGLFSL